MSDAGIVAIGALLVFVAAKGEEMLCIFSERTAFALGLTAALVLVQGLVLGAERTCRCTRHEAQALAAAQRAPYAATRAPNVAARASYAEEATR
jgi:hypothetical protein